MQPIATYVEKGGFAKRMYLLYEDKIELKGKRTNYGDFEMEIAVKDLQSPKAIVYRPRAAAMLPGLAVFAGLLFFCATLTEHSEIVFWTLLAASFAGMVLGPTVAKKIKFYSYNRVSGVPAFDISERGNRRENFEAFCELIDQQISKCNTSS